VGGNRYDVSEPTNCPDPSGGRSDPPLPGRSAATAALSDGPASADFAIFAAWLAAVRLPVCALCAACACVARTGFACGFDPEPRTGNALALLSASSCVLVNCSAERSICGSDLNA
jgi:hypothetical protein